MDTQNAKWYILFTSTGYEQLVKTTIEKKVENNNLHSVVLDVKIPIKERIETKEVNGKEKTKVVTEKIYPCYVFIKMVYSNEIWYKVLKSTSGLRGFANGEAIPLTDKEVKDMRLEENEATGLSLGEEVKVVSGALEGYSGVIEELDDENKKAKVRVNMFGRDTVVEVEYIRIEKLI